MIDKQKMMQLLEESPMAMDSTLDDDFRAWDIDPESFREFMDHMIMKTMRDFLDDRQAHVLYYGMASLVVMAFSLGMRVAQEQEMERIARGE